MTRYRLVSPEHKRSSPKKILCWTHLPIFSKFVLLGALEEGEEGITIDQGNGLSSIPEKTGQDIPAPTINPYYGVDLSGTKNMEQRLIRIGQHLALTDTLLNITEVSQWLVDNTNTTQVMQAIRPKVTNVLSQSSHFLRINPGYYRYVSEPHPYYPHEKDVPDTFQ